MQAYHDLLSIMMWMGTALFVALFNRASPCYVIQQRKLSCGGSESLGMTRVLPEASSSAVDRRRIFLTASSAAVALFPPLVLADDDLTSTLFNPDGSLKEGVAREAKFRTVEISWDESDTLAVNVDGVNAAGTQQGGSVKINYKVPEKWATGSGPDEIYFDRSEGVNARACSHITVYRARGEVPMERIDKATRIGIAKALDVIDDLKALESADLVGGRTETRGDNKYYEFDMAVAPASCDKSKDDLGLGFCSYDTIYLLSATVVNSHLYVLAIESDKSEWKRANSDLKLVRSSFSVRAS